MTEIDPNAYQRGIETGRGAFDGVATVIKQRSLQRALTDFQADPNNAQARAYADLLRRRMRSTCRRK